MSTISAVDAANLWNDLRSAFVNAENKIQEIIATRAWEPLGYDSFAEAWTARMDGVRLATQETRAHVVYQMFDEGFSSEQVYERLGVGTGVSAEAVKDLRRQKANGVPAGSTVVRSHARKKPGPSRTVAITLDPTEYALFKRKAKRAGVEVVDVFLDAGREAFKAMR